MFRFSHAAVATGFLCLLATTPVHAQQQVNSRRSGFWGSIGLGYGSADVGCPGCSGDRENGVSGFLSLGATLSPRFLIGAESDGWTKDESGVTVSFYNLSGVLYFYPLPRSDFFLKGGAGLGGTRVSVSGASASETGFGFIGGAGYDIPVGRTISITPTVTYAWADPGAGYTQNFLQLAAAVTFH